MQVLRWAEVLERRAVGVTELGWIDADAQGEVRGEDSIFMCLNFRLHC